MRAPPPPMFSCRPPPQTSNSPQGPRGKATTTRWRNTSNTSSNTITLITPLIRPRPTTIPQLWRPTTGSSPTTLRLTCGTPPPPPRRATTRTPTSRPWPATQSRRSAACSRIRRHSSNSSRSSSNIIPLLLLRRVRNGAFFQGRLVQRFIYLPNRWASFPERLSDLY